MGYLGEACQASGSQLRVGRPALPFASATGSQLPLRGSAPECLRELWALHAAAPLPRDRATGPASTPHAATSKSATTAPTPPGKVMVSYGAGVSVGSSAVPPIQPAGAPVQVA